MENFFSQLLMVVMVIVIALIGVLTYKWAYTEISSEKNDAPKMVSSSSVPEEVRMKERKRNTVAVTRESEDKVIEDENNDTEN